MAKKQMRSFEVVKRKARAMTGAPGSRAAAFPTTGFAGSPLFRGPGGFRKSVLAAQPELEHVAGRPLDFAEAAVAFTNREAEARFEHERLEAAALERQAEQREQDSQRRAEAAIRREAQEKLFSAEKERCASLATLQCQAAGLGVSFDLAAAIGCGMTVEAARAAVFDAKATAEEATEIYTSGIHATASDANRADEVKAGWNAAVDRVSERRGLSVRPIAIRTLDEQQD